MRHETLFDRTRGIRGNRTTIFSICQHGKNTIRNGKPNEYCETCDGPRNQSFYVPDMTPFFNRGLGCVTNGTRDAEKKAKRKGLVPIGDASPKQAFKTLYPNHRLTKGMK